MLLEMEMMGKIANVLESTAIVVYPVHVVVMNCSAKYLRFLLEQGYSVVTFQPVKASIDLIEGCCTVEDRSSVNLLTGTDEVSVEGT